MVAGLGGYAALRAGNLAPLAGAATVGALVLLLLALAGFVGLVGWALALAAAGYLVIDLARSMPLAAAPFYGAGLLLAAELAYASRELRTIPEERPARRVPWLVAVALCALGAGYVPVAATGASAPSGFPAELLALLAAGALLGILAVVARRPQASASRCR